MVILWCAVFKRLETECTILAQALTPLAIRSPVIEAAAANKAWLLLTQNSPLELNIEGDRTKIPMLGRPCRRAWYVPI